MAKFIKEFYVHYYEINKFQEATPITILNYLEEAAISHSDSVGYGVNRLLSDGNAWVLNRWSIDILKYPRLNEKVIVETWPSGFERFYGIREFRILNSDNELLGNATSQWIFLNVEKRRPTRIPTELGEAYGIIPERAIDDTFNEIIQIQNENIQSVDFSVRRSDIDTNNHVNNASYLEWVLEAVPQEIYETCYVTKLKINYKKELNLGSYVVSECCLSDNTSICLDFSHCIKNKDDNTELTVATTTWKKR